MNWELFKQQCNNEQIQNYGVLEKDIEAFKIVRIPSYGFTPETYHSCRPVLLVEKLIPLMEIK